MQTKVVKIKENDYSSLQEAGEITRAGGLVAFPTETVYGLGGDALNPASSCKIYEAKGRPSDNPLIIHIANKEDLDYIVKNQTEQARRLVEKFWPGPLTMIFEKSECVPLETTGGLTTVAVRMPAHDIALAYIRQTGGYVAAPSANLSGRPSPTLAKHVIEDMSGRIDMILDGGQVGIGIESTIVDTTSEVPMILRPGAITKEMLEEEIGQVDWDETIFQQLDKVVPKAPGMKYKHYAPKGELTIIDGDRFAVCETINRYTELQREQNERVGVIATDETMKEYHADSVKSVGSRQDEEMIAHRIYAILREFDEEGITIIYSESFSTKGMGQAIMNRLLKAAGHRVEQVL